MGRALKSATSLGVAFLLALTACGGDDDSSKADDATSTSPTTEATETTPPTILDDYVSIDGGRELQVRCYGAGSPTVLLEAGGSGDMDDWPTPFVDLLAAETTTCLYSRAGSGLSTPIEGPQTRDQLVGDAYSLLGSLNTDHGVEGPYVFVGWSFGGSVALAEALEHPKATAGLVILDTNFPSDFVPACIASGHPRNKCQAIYTEDEDAKSVEKDIFAAVHPLPDIPIAVVSALALPDCYVESGATSVTAEIAGTDVTAKNCTALGIAIADKNKADWGQLGPQVTDTRIDADHDGLVEAAAEQIAAIVLQMVTSAR